MIDLTLGQPGRGRRRPVGGRLLALIGIAGALAVAGAPVAYMVWPQRVPVAVGAPALPITIGGVTFVVPQAAVRVPLQRRPGTQSRVDLVFAWPSLRPPAPVAKGFPDTPAGALQRLFVTIAAGDGTLSPTERLKVIYPRYTADTEPVGRNGLVVRNFRAGTPYQGEQLIYDPAAPERFLLRCTHAVSSTPGICLHERRIGGADVTARFPRDWLGDWRDTATRIERLMAQLRPANG